MSSGLKVSVSGCESEAGCECVRGSGRRSVTVGVPPCGRGGELCGPEDQKGLASAWAGNRTRASRVAGENSTTEPPMPQAQLSTDALTACACCQSQDSLAHLAPTHPGPKRCMEVCMDVCMRGCVDG